MIAYDDDIDLWVREEDLPKIWTRFFRADESRTRESEMQPSSGLGLAIAKGIVDLHGGWITAKSEEGRGACFSFGLPKTAPASVA